MKPRSARDNSSPVVSAAVVLFCDCAADTEQLPTDCRQSQSMHSSLRVAPLLAPPRHPMRSVGARRRYYCTIRFDLSKTYRRNRSVSFPAAAPSSPPASRFATPLEKYTCARVKACCLGWEGAFAHSEGEAPWQMTC